MDEDFDIYGDLASIHEDENKSKDREEDTSKIKEDKNILAKELEELRLKLKKIESRNNYIETNYSSLLMTAKAEVSRKDRTITDLRAKLDNLTFRRNRQPKIEPNFIIPPPILPPPLDPFSQFQEIIKNNFSYPPPPIDPTYYQQTNPNHLSFPPQPLPSLSSSNHVAHEEVHDEYFSPDEETDNDDTKSNIKEVKIKEEYPDTLYGKRLRERLLNEQENEKKKKEAESKNLENKINQLGQQEAARKKISQVQEKKNELRQREQKKNKIGQQEEIGNEVRQAKENYTALKQQKEIKNELSQTEEKQKLRTADENQYVLKQQEERNKTLRKQEQKKNDISKPEQIRSELRQAEEKINNMKHQEDKKKELMFEEERKFKLKQQEEKQCKISHHKEKNKKELQQQEQKNEVRHLEEKKNIQQQQEVRKRNVEQSQEREKEVKHEEESEHEIEQNENKKQVKQREIKKHEEEQQETIQNKIQTHEENNMNEKQPDIKYDEENPEERIKEEENKNNDDTTYKSELVEQSNNKENLSLVNKLSLNPDDNLSSNKVSGSGGHSTEIINPFDNTHFTEHFYTNRKEVANDEKYMNTNGGHTSSKNYRDKDNCYDSLIQRDHRNQRNHVHNNDHNVYKHRSDNYCNTDFCPRNSRYDQYKSEEHNHRRSSYKSRDRERSKSAYRYSRDPRIRRNNYYQEKFKYKKDERYKDNSEEMEQYYRNKFKSTNYKKRSTSEETMSPRKKHRADNDKSITTKLYERSRSNPKITNDGEKYLRKEIIEYKSIEKPQSSISEKIRRDEDKGKIEDTQNLLPKTEAINQNEITKAREKMIPNRTQMASNVSKKTKQEKILLKADYANLFGDTEEGEIVDYPQSSLLVREDEDKLNNKIKTVENNEVVLEDKIRIQESHTTKISTTATHSNKDTCHITKEYKKSSESIKPKNQEKVKETVPYSLLSQQNPTSNCSHTSSLLPCKNKNTLDNPGNNVTKSFNSDSNILNEKDKKKTEEKSISVETNLIKIPEKSNKNTILKSDIRVHKEIHYLNKNTACDKMEKAILEKSKQKVNSTVHKKIEKAVIVKPTSSIKNTKAQKSNDLNNDVQSKVSNDISIPENKKTCLNEKIVGNKSHIKKEENAKLQLHKNMKSTSTETMQDIKVETLQTEVNKEIKINNVLKKQPLKSFEDSEVPVKKSKLELVGAIKTIVPRSQLGKNVIIIRRRKRPVQLADSPPVLVVKNNDLNKSK